MEGPESLVDGRVVSRSGRDLGVIREIRNGTASVDPEDVTTDAEIAGADVLPWR